MNKKAWIKITEAFVSITIIAVVLLVVITQGYFEQENIPSEIYDLEISILREIQLNETLREETLNGEVPISFENFPQKLKDKIENKIPNFLDCEAIICSMNDKNCYLEEFQNKDIYSQSVTITSTLNKINYRQLKLFCWEK